MHSLASILSISLRFPLLPLLRIPLHSLSSCFPAHPAYVMSVNSDRVFPALHPFLFFLLSRLPRIPLHSCMAVYMHDQ